MLLASNMLSKVFFLMCLDDIDSFHVVELYSVPLLSSAFKNMRGVDLNKSFKALLISLTLSGFCCWACC